MNQNEPQIMMIENGNGKKVKKIILDEDLFVSQLDRIIERDFFPDLKKLKLNQQLNKNDKLIDSTSLQSNNEDDKQIKIEDNITLGQFLNKFTSEDNASFNEIIEATNKRHQEKYPWFHLDEDKIKQQIENNLTIDNEKINNKEDKMVTWTYKNKNAIMFNPDGCELTTKELLEEKSKNKQTIAIENTRFRKAPFRKITYKLNTNQTDSSTTTTTTNLDSTNNTPNQTKFIQSKYNPCGDLINLERKEYKLVESTPLIDPNQMESPLMVWGEIGMTPLHLNEDDCPTPSSGRFKIPELSAREQTAIKLTDSFSKSKKQKLNNSNQKLWTPSPNLLSSPRTPRLDQLSPAVQQFAQSKLRLNIKNDLKSISINRFSGKTPSPSIKSSSLSSFIKSPSLNKINNQSTSRSITDNLLNLSKND